MIESQCLRRARSQALEALIRSTHSVDDAEEYVQVALLRGLEIWPYRGVPDDPAAWLVRVAYNAFLDGRRRRSGVARIPAEVETREAEPFGADLDEMERALFLRCHGHGVPPSSQPVLTLRLVGGLSLPQIQSCLGLSAAAVDKRLSRGRSALRARWGSEVPALRLDVALVTIGLVFGFGYQGIRTSRGIREDRAVLALDLIDTLTALPEVAGEPRLWACKAWMLLTAARIPARWDASGRLLMSFEQRRADWSPELIRLGLDALSRAQAGPVSDWHLLASIAAFHAEAEDEPNWSGIRARYDQLEQRNPDRRFAVGHALATWHTCGPEAALRILKGSSEDSPGRWLLEVRLLTALGRPKLRAAQRALDASRTEDQRAQVHRVLSDLTGAKPRGYQSDS